MVHLYKFIFKILLLSYNANLALRQMRWTHWLSKGIQIIFYLILPITHFYIYENPFLRGFFFLICNFVLYSFVVFLQEMIIQYKTFFHLVIYFCQFFINTLLVPNEFHQNCKTKKSYGKS